MRTCFWALVYCFCACASSKQLRPHESSTPVAAPPVERSIDPGYKSLDPSLHHYAMQKADLADHYLATFHDNEAAFCEIDYATDKAITTRCGFPATMLTRDSLPASHSSRVDELTKAVKEDSPQAASIHFKYLGRYRRILVQEAAPCSTASGEFEHGLAFSEVEINLGEKNQLVSTRLLGGSQCTCVPFFWAWPSATWLVTTSQITQLWPDKAGNVTVPLSLLEEIKGVVVTAD